MTELIFKGKEFVYNHHLAVPHRPLVIDADKSVGKPDLAGNLIIQGDNLHALKALLPIYGGKVDCIFIDPPYNTGNEGWSYNDKVNAPMIKEWLKDNPVGVEDGLRHNKWCAMMWPRLKLLHELLAEDGIIIVHIDDNEESNLRQLMDEIFFKDNYLSNLVWNLGTGTTDVLRFISGKPLKMASFSSNFVLMARTGKCQRRLSQARPIRLIRLSINKGNRCKEACLSVFTKWK